MNRQANRQTLNASLMRRFFWLAVPFTFAALFLSLFLVLPVRGQDNQETVIIRVKTDDFGQVAPIEAVHTIDYGSYVWLELTPTQFAELQGTGVDFVQPSRPTVLQFQGYRFDTRFEEPAIPHEQRADIVSGTPQLYVLQFIGPPKDEWRNDIETAGVEFIQPHPRLAYLVRMTPEQAAMVESQEVVRWVGPYHPAFKITQNLVQRFSSSGPRDALVEVSITIYDDRQADGTVDQTIRLLEAYGGELIDRKERIHSAAPLSGVIFRLPVRGLLAAARLNNVIHIDNAPQAAVEDEMSGQIIAGNYDPLQPGYRAWLTATGVSGAGVIVSLVDTGYDTDDPASVHPDVRGRLVFPDVTGETGIITGGIGVFTDAHGHGTHVGGIIVGDATLGSTDPSGYLLGLGVAPDAHMVVRPAVTRYEDVGGHDDWQRDSVNSGAVASNNSYAYQRNTRGYSDTDALFDQLVRDGDLTTNMAEPLIMVFGAGNCGMGDNFAGPLCIDGFNGPTTQAKNTIAVGATANQRDDDGAPDASLNIEAVWDRSSRGPTVAYSGENDHFFRSKAITQTGG